MGDQFLKENVNTFLNSHQKAIANKRDPPYLLQFYNVKTCYGSPTRGLNQFISPFIQGLNENKVTHLPKYILFIMDKDYIEALKCYNIESGLVMGVTLHHLIRQIDILIDKRKFDVLQCRPGAHCEEYPKVIWVRMIKQPKVDIPDKQKVQNLRGKFYSILEERLLDGHVDRHKIISIVVQPNGFNAWGDLTPDGQESFWKEIDTGMKKFDHDEITLKPRNFKKKDDTSQNNKELDKKKVINAQANDKPDFLEADLRKYKEQERNLKLKTPPPKRPHSPSPHRRPSKYWCSHSRSHSHSRNRHHKYN